MKFQHVKIGQQFHYQGETYVKATPLVASHAKTGQQKLIPRYAVIQLLESGPAPASRPSPTSLSTSQVRTAVEQFHALSLQALRDILPPGDNDTLQAIQARLDAAHTHVLQQLKLDD